MDVRTVVVGVDGTPCSDPALDWAAAEASLRGVPLEILHLREQRAPSSARVHEPGLPPEADADWTILEAAKERAAVEHPELPVELRSWADDVAAGLVSRSEDAALVVVGTHHRNWLSRLIVGSVSHDVARRCRCPAVVVHTALPAADLPVVVGVDGSPGSDLAVRAAAREAVRRGTPLVVAHSWAPTVIASFDAMAIPPEVDESQERYADHVVRQAVELATSDEPGLEVRSRVLQGYAGAALVAESERASLLVLGVHGASGLARSFLGSVTAACVDDARCPVMVVPHGEQVHEGTQVR